MPKRACVSRKPRKPSGRFRARLLTLYLVNKDVSKHKALLEVKYFLSYRYVRKFCSYFYKWLFGAEMFSGLSRNAPEALTHSPRVIKWPLNLHN